jgi:DNA repair protein RadA/Sms
VEEAGAASAPAPRGSRAGPVEWAGASGGEPAIPMNLTDIDTCVPVPTGLAELDRVLAGGFVPGSATLVAGEPGTGKSTLLLQAAGSLASSGLRALVVSGEESRAQVQARAQRLGTLAESLWVLSETSLPDLLAAVSEVEPLLLVVDSIQTLYDPAVDSAPGSVGQVRHCAQRLVTVAKESGTAVVLVGHVTKDGAIAGPRQLEHLVDTVLSFEGDRHHGLRLLRAIKHRFGPTGELGLFEMGGAGLVEVADPSAHLLGDRRPNLSGCLVLPAIEGGRPLLVEVQSLVMSTGNEAMARRSAQGLDSGRLPMLLAVLDRRAGIKLSKSDVYVSVVGGVRVTEPAADLAVLLSLASAEYGRALPDDTVVFGEVGLGGEVRQVAHGPRRLAESARLGFRRAIVPASLAEGPPGLQLDRVERLDQAVARMGSPPSQ